MSELLLEHSDQTRLISFFSILVLMAVLEFFLPKRDVPADRKVRWSSNIGIVILDALIARIVLPTTTIAVALYAEKVNFGLFNLTNTSQYFSVIFSLLTLDALIYFQHVIFHKVPLLWRFHRMHHSDTHIDVTTGIRFHPVEIILSLLIKFAAVIILGIPAFAIILFEIILNVTAMITHSNLKIPVNIDKYIRKVFVTPDMHRIHHSVHRFETDSNYGFNLSVWDRLFNTYNDQPVDSHEKMLIGIHEFRDKRNQFIDKLLTQPFRTDKQQDEI